MGSIVHRQVEVEVHVAGDVWREVGDGGHVRGRDGRVEDDAALRTPRPKDHLAYQQRGLHRLGRNGVEDRGWGWPRPLGSDGLWRGTHALPCSV